jgi:predicted amidophosphoribosyltransferase
MNWRVSGVFFAAGGGDAERRAAGEYPDRRAELSTMATTARFTTRFTVPSLATLAGGLLDRLLPPRCPLCTGPLPAGHDAACAGCVADLPWLAAGCRRCGLPLPGGAGPCCPVDCALPAGAALDRVVAPLVYAWPVDRLVARAKFGRSLADARLLGQLLAAGLRWTAAPLPPGAVVVPVPLHWRRLARRGFNQATEIARVVAADLGLPLAPARLRRPVATPAQSGLGQRARRRNVAGAFVAAPAAGEPVLLIDDVVTTVATGLAAAAALRTAGAGPVVLCAVARALPPGPQPGGVDRNV